MIEAKLAYKKLFEAIKSIEKDYLTVDYDESVPDCELQTERSFAYVLCSRWSSLLDQHPEKPISSNTLRLGGELTKHFKYKNGVISPDIVLHGGQKDIQNQLIACEIKRELKDKKEVLQDIIKLYHYLNLRRVVIIDENNDECDYKDAKYQIAVFIALNTSIADLKQYIHQLFEEFSSIEIEPKYLDGISSKEDLKEAILSHGEKIICISVDTSSDNERTIVKPTLLRDCILNNPYHLL